MHDAAVMMLHPDKQNKLINTYRSKPTPFPEFVKIAEKRFCSCRDFLSNPDVNSNRSFGLKKALANAEITTICQIPSPETIKVVYFEPLLITVLDGLLANAFDHQDEDNHSFLIRLILDAMTVKLEVENTTTETNGRLLARLHSPGADMVGITNLHWMAKGFWPDDTDHLHWRIENDGGKLRLIACALIAKVEGRKDTYI